MLIGSRFCDAVNVFSIVIGVCEQTIASSLMATIATRTKVVSMSTWVAVAIAFPISRWKCRAEKVCGKIDDCGREACRNGNCRRCERLHV